MKLWSKGKSIDKKIEEFTIGNDRVLDLQLAKWDVLGSLAHVKMLNTINLIDDNDCKEICKELTRILKEEINKEEFTIEEGIEDIHSQIELMLTNKLGDSGKKIHSGRSRNDQVLLDLKLFFRSEIKDITILLKQLFNAFISTSEKNKNVLMPGYTHTQIAMPSSFGLWFGAYGECLVDDLTQLRATYKICNQNPLGSAAGYGSSFPLNRTLTTELLGFDELAYNSIYAQMGRGRTEKSLAFSLASIASTIGKFSADVCLFNSQNFKFITLPDEYTTGSSIMPHKKNPDVFELLRGKCNKIQGLPNSISLALANLTTGYHRDLQLLKEELFPAIQETKASIEILTYALDKIQVNEEILSNSLYDLIFTVEDVNKLVYKGVPFRDAYRQIGQAVERGEYKPSKTVSHTHEGSIGNLSNDKIKMKFERELNSFEFGKVDKSLTKLVSD